jgi:sugar O-acyltransferase (sialic acid O-acetyltransferase NeuD family)
MILKSFMSKKIAILGAGGHGKVVGEIALLNKFKIIHFFDDRVLDSSNKFPFPVMGTFKNIINNKINYDAYFVAIGDNKVRYEKMNFLKKKTLVNLIHPKSTVSKFTFLGKGICVMAQAVINPGTSIGDGAIINTSSTIDHDCAINNFAHISPNCSLSGSVRVGKFTHLGTGTSVHPGISIGDNVKTGVGSKIFKNILNNKIYKN